MSDPASRPYPRPVFPQPPQSDIDTAKRAVPDVLTWMENETGWGAQKPDGVHRIVLALRLVQELTTRRHNPAAAEWAVFELVQAGLLVPSPGREVKHPLVGYQPKWDHPVVKARRYFGSVADKYQSPVYGPPETVIRDDRWLVRSTDALWNEWQGAPAAGLAVGTADPPIPPVRALVPLANTVEADGGKPSGERGSKRSTTRGEARAKIIGALTAHHNYADGGCLNQDPISVTKLAGTSQAGKASASRFFAAIFGGHAKYRNVYCKNKHLLLTALKKLNGDYAVDELFGGTPPPKRKAQKRENGEE
jgi:hypothetical protein